MTKERKLSRREFLKVTGAAAAVTALGVTPAAASPKAIHPPTVIGQPFSGKTLRVHAISGGNYDVGISIYGCTHAPNFYCYQSDPSC